MREGDMEFIRRKIFESQYRKVLLGTVRGLRKFPVGEENNRQDGGNSNFRQTVFVSYYRKSSLGTLRCFRNFLAAKTTKECEEGYDVFPSSYFCLTVPGNFIGNSSVFQKFSVSEKIAWKRERERGIPGFSVALFLCHSFGNWHWEPFVVSEHF